MEISENTSKNTHNVVANLLFATSANRILDIPSGAGAFTKRLLNKGLEVHSADIENIMGVENIHFRMADMNKALPYSDDYFDSVVCIDGIEHLENPFYFVRECKRIVRPGGSVIISTPNINSIRSRWRWFWTGHHNKCKVPLNENKMSFLHHINMMSYQRLRYILHTNELSISKVTTNRIKFISWLYSLFIPLSYLFTILVYNKEENDQQQRKVNREIVKEVFSKPLLFGETMIVMAIKK